MKNKKIILVFLIIGLLLVSIRVVVGYAYADCDPPCPEGTWCDRAKPGPNGGGLCEPKVYCIYDCTVKKKIYYNKDYYIELEVLLELPAYVGSCKSSLDCPLPEIDLKQEDLLLRKTPLRYKEVIRCAAAKSCVAQIPQVDKNSKSQTSRFSTYITRELGPVLIVVEYTDYYAPPEKDGVAYQFLPSGLQFNTPIDVTLKHEGNLFYDVDGIGIYRYEDLDIQQTCVIDELNSTSKLIGISGDKISLEDAELSFPSGALGADESITIRKVILICDFSLANIFNQVSNRGRSEETIRKIIKRWVLGY